MKKLSYLFLILCLSWFATAAQAFTTTTNYAFQLPQVNNVIDQNLWGAELNSNFSSLDSLLLTATNLVTTTISTNTTLTNANQNQLIEVNAASGAITVTLQASATAANGFKLVVKKIDSSANTVTVKANASETIDGANTYVITNQFNAIALDNDSTQWLALATITPPVTVPNATTSVVGIVQLSSNSDTGTGTNTATAVTPASLSSLATAGTTGTFTVGAVRVQWGTSTSSPSGGLTSTFGTAFSGTPYMIFAQSTLNSSASALGCNTSSWTSTTFVCYGGNGAGGNQAFNYAAIGPK